jgi:hypothetical protein
MPTIDCAFCFQWRTCQLSFRCTDWLGTDCMTRLANPAKHQPKFPAGQPWFRVDKELIFIDENESTIFGDGQLLDFEDDVEDSVQLPSSTSDPIPLSHLEGASTEQQDRVSGRIQASGQDVGTAKDLGHSQASTRFETLVEAAAECRAERSRSVPTDLATEATTDANFTALTTGISPVFEFTLDNRISPKRASLYQSRLSDCNDALSPHNFRSFGSPKDPSTGRITEISPEAAFSLPTTPILSPHEARLMQHFIEHLAPSIDVVCQNSIFGRLVPRMAFLSPILLTSIFAVASKHISKTIGLTDPTPETYFQETLDHLIPVLNEPDALIEDYILAAVVILRVMEEMDSKCRYSRQT